MGDSFKKVQTGDKLRIPAAAYNAFIDSAMDLRARQQNQGQTPQAAYRTSGIVLVKNASGADQDRFAVLGVERPIYTPEDNLDSFKNKVALVGVVPTVQDHYGRFVVLLEPLKAGAIGMAYGAGVCPVKVNIPDGGQGHQFADVSDGSTGTLLAAPLGAAFILWKEDDEATGEMWAVVRIGNISIAPTPVGVATDGGDAGDADSACTFTYKWTDPAGEEHTESAPLWHRQEGRAGAYIAGEHGLAARDEDGAWVLLVVDETPDVGAGADGGWGGGGGGDCGCCDPAPCECAEGVTAATLTVTGHIRVTHTSHGLICDSDFSIPYTPNADEPPVSCLWGGPYVLRWSTPFVTFEPGITEGQVPAQVTYAEVRLDTSLCQWTLGFGTPCGAGIKTTGNQPMGAYSDSTCSESGYTFEFTDLEVTE